MSWCRVLNKESPLSFRAHDARYRLFDPTLYCARPRAHVDRFDTETARRSHTDTHARANNTRHRHEAQCTRQRDAATVVAGSTLSHPQPPRACCRSRSVVVLELEVVVRREVRLEGIRRRLRGGGVRRPLQSHRPRLPPSASSRCWRPCLVRTRMRLSPTSFKVRYNKRIVG